jgi:hypothetical protein
MKHRRSVQNAIFRAKTRISFALFVAFLCLATCVSPLKMHASGPRTPSDGDFLAPLSVVPEAIEPVSVDAVAVSDACERLADMQQNLESRFPSGALERIQGPQQRPPLGAAGKFRMMVKDDADPLNAFATAMDAGFSTYNAQKNSVYGTGWAGFGRQFGTSMADNFNGEFFTTFAAASIFHQDPRYYRDSDQKNWGKRVAYAVSRVLIARSDSGKAMFNFDETLGNMAAGFVGNAYHFDQNPHIGPTIARWGVGIGTDAAWNLLTEFLPDAAKHLNPPVGFMRRLAGQLTKEN